MRGVKTRLSIHPLFLLAGILSAFTGDLLVFLAAVLAAIEHECAHAFCARRYGYALDKIVLMPYGAVLTGDFSGMSRREELAVCLAGPLASGATALGFTALWWLFPESYPYTDVAAMVSASLCIVNLLPAYPLDGGRALRVLLSFLGRRKSEIICRIVSAVTAAGIAGVFLYTCVRGEPSFSALVFCIMLAISFPGGSYRPAVFTRDLTHGVAERRIALSASLTVRDALRYLREDSYLTLLLFEGNEFLAELTEEEYLRAVEEGKFSQTLSSLLSSV